MQLKINKIAKTSGAGLEQNLQASDTIVFTSFISLIAHILLILGISYTFTSTQDKSSIELVLLNQPSEEKPFKAKFSARDHQKGSGEDNVDIAARILHSPLLVSPELSFQSRLVFSDNILGRESSFNSNIGGKDIITSTYSFIDSNQGLTGANPNSKILGVDKKKLDAEIESVEAYLGKLEREYATKPKIKRYTSIAAHKSVEADYIHRWVKKIEATGNLNYPPQAIKENISGSLRLVAVISSDGKTVATHILKGSGYKILDDAARQIVYIASPFGSFPSELKKEADLIEIVRTWNFYADKNNNKGLRFETQAGNNQ